MPPTNLGRNLSGTALAGLLALLVGCATPPNMTRGDLGRDAPGPSSAMESRSNGPTGPSYAAGPIPVTASVTETHYPPDNAAPAVATASYTDPNGVPAGAAPTGPVMAPPQGAANGPGGPPSGDAGPSPSAPMVVAPVSASPKKSDEDNEWDWSHLAPDYTWKELQKAFGFGPDQKLARASYDKGQALYNAALASAKNHDEAAKMKNYEEAAKEFNTASWRWPDSTMEEDAMFLEGESNFFSDHYAAAQDAYVNLLKKHDNTRYLDTVVARLFAIATYWEQTDLRSPSWPVVPNPIDKTQPWFDTFGNALACYQEVWLHDPTGPLADAALFRVGNAHFRRGEWEDAAAAYDTLRKNHPKSKYQKDAHLLELQAKMRIYEGAKYSSVPLNDAQEIADQTLKQFRGQLGDEERRVREAQAVLFEQRAEREWVMAQYYDRKSEFRAARTYYTVLLQKYPQTSFAERARKRMQEIQNQPDEPPNNFKWLTAPFGSGK